MQSIEYLHKSYGDLRVTLGLILHPIGKGHKDVDRLHDVGLLVEALNDGGELDQFVGQPTDRRGIVTGVDVFDQVVDSHQQFVNQFWARDAPRGAQFLPSILVDPC